MSQTINTTVEPQGYIMIVFNGDLVEGSVEVFKKELSEASVLIQKEHHEHGKKVRILLDTTNFTGNYALAALAALVEFAKFNKAFVEKTASFGGSEKVHMAGEAAIALSGRDNIHMFKNKVDAVMWLLG
ncbi:MAG: hypothetical protein RJB39_749 [Candidatus Parcubacteria bacterium]|jgi:hypothetical protein